MTTKRELNRLEAGALRYRKGQKEDEINKPEELKTKMNLVIQLLFLCRQIRMTSKSIESPKFLHFNAKMMHWLILIYFQQKYGKSYYRGSLLQTI